MGLTTRWHVSPRMHSRFAIEQQAAVGAVQLVLSTGTQLLKCFVQRTEDGGPKPWVLRRILKGQLYNKRTRSCLRGQANAEFILAAGGVASGAKPMRTAGGARGGPQLTHVLLPA
eukprot:gene17678-24030_t